FTLRSNVDEMQGHLALLMKNSLADGVIDNEEEQKIKMMLDGLISLHTIEIWQTEARGRTPLASPFLDIAIFNFSFDVTKQTHS
ncbi:hypothetical protein E4V22_07815, partial [Proteus mirabilis]